MQAFQNQLAITSKILGSYLSAAMSHRHIHRSVYEKVIDMSLVSDFRDFEDAVQYYSAIHAKADCVITRNKADYRDNRIPVLAPDDREIDLLLNFRIRQFF